MGGGQIAMEINWKRILPAVVPAVREEWIPDDTVLLDARSDVICLIGSDRRLQCHLTSGFRAPGDFVPSPIKPDDDVQQVWLGPRDDTAIVHGKFDGSVRAHWTESFNRVVTHLGNDVASISVGWSQVCALKQGGSVWCFGPGYSSFSEIEVKPPHEVSLPGRARSIASGIERSCAVLDDDLVWCWGSATAEGGESPVAVDITGVRTLVMGADHACALKDDGTVWCWGGNCCGQTGQPPVMGSDRWNLVPRQISGLGEGVQAITAGYTTTCARKIDGTVWCWGGSGYGQLGSDKVVNSDPVMLRGCE